MIVLPVPDAPDPAAGARPSPPPGGAGAARDRRTVAGVALAALLCFGLGAYLAFRLPPFFGGDERAHFSYTVTLLDGRIPALTDGQPYTNRYPIIVRSLDPAGPRPPLRQGIFVAAHPPLAYALAAPAVWAAGQVGSDELPTLAFRLVNAASMAVGVALVGLFAAELFPGRREVAVGAAALAAVVPQIVGVAAYAHNDGAAFALTTACLFVGARMLRRGISAGRVVAASLVAAAAMLTRASAAVAVVALAASAALAAWRWGAERRAAPAGADGRAAAGGAARGGRWVAAAAAAGAGLAVGGTAAVASGPFYWRNQRLYGSPTADTYLLEAFQRRPQGTVLEVLGDGTYHANMWSGLYGRMHPRLPVWHPGWVVGGLAAIMALGLAVAAFRRVRARALVPDGGAAAPPSASVPDRRSVLDRAPGIGVGGWVILAGYCSGVVVATARFYADGGGPHPRYLFGLVPVTSALLARAIAELPWPRLVLALVVGAQLAVIRAQVVHYPDLIHDSVQPRPFIEPSAGSAAQWAALALAAAAGVGLAVALGTGTGRDAGGRRRGGGPAAPVRLHRSGQDAASNARTVVRGA